MPYRVGQMLASCLGVQDLRCVVIAVLVDLGFATDFEGFGYLVEAVVRYVRDPSRAVAKHLYQQIAGSDDPDNAAAIEDAIRRAIRKAWSGRDEATWQIYFPSCTKRPTNAVLIAQLGQFMLLWQECCGMEEGDKMDIYPRA